MRLLERYVFWELIRVFSLLVIISTLLLVFVGIFTQVKEHGLGPWEILQILPYVPPTLLPYTIPATMLLAVCIVYGRMAGDREIIAAKAAGISILSLVWPSYFLGGVLSVGSLFLTDQAIPWAYGNIERIVTQAMENIFLDVLRTQTQLSLRDQGISITVMDVKDRVLIMPTFRYSPKGGEPVTVQAEEARIHFDLDRQEVVLQLKKGYTKAPGKLGVNLRFNDTVEERFPIPAARKNFRTRNLRIVEMQRHLQETVEERDRFRQQDALDAAFSLIRGDFDRLTHYDFSLREHNLRENFIRERKMNTEIHQRFAMASSCLFFVLVGSPFAIHMARRQFLTNFLFCFLPILIIYYPVSMMAQNLSKTGVVNPQWAVWTANLLLLPVACWLLRRVTIN